MTKYNGFWKLRAIQLSVFHSSLHSSVLTGKPLRLSEISYGHQIELLSLCCIISELSVICGQQEMKVLWLNVMTMIWWQVKYECSDVFFLSTGFCSIEKTLNSLDLSYVAVYCPTRYKCVHIWYLMFYFVCRKVRVPTGNSLKMATLSLKISVVGSNVVKTMQFDPSTIVFDACKIIRDKIPENNVGQRKCKYLYFNVQSQADIICSQEVVHGLKWAI